MNSSVRLQSEYAIRNPTAAFRIYKFTHRMHRSADVILLTCAPRECDTQSILRSLALLNLALGIEVLESLLDALRHRLLAFTNPDAGVVVPTNSLVKGY